MIRFSQNDPRWKDEKLGTSQTTIKEYGCLVCCVAMACQAKGYAETPATINAKFKATFPASGAGFAQGNLINLWALPYAVPGMKYIYHLNCKDVASPIAEINQFLAQGAVVIVLVDYDPEKVGIQPHYVVLERQAGDDYLILDPVPLKENGGVVTLLSRFGYGKTAYEAIYEVCVFGSTGSPQMPQEPMAEPVDVALPKAGEVWRVTSDYVNDRYPKPSIASLDVGDVLAGTEITLSADAVTDAEGTVWLPRTETHWVAMSRKGKTFMEKVSPAKHGEQQ